MPDTPNPVSPSSAPHPPASQKTQADAGHMPITEELDSPKWTLPPIVPVLGAAAAIAIVVAIIAFTTRAKPVAAGSITKIAAVDQQDNVLVAIKVQMDNKIEKQLWIRDISSELESGDGQKYLDHAAPAIDVSRYLKAFPALKEAQADTLREELKIPSGTSYTGFAVFAFPVDKKAFDGRKSLTVRIGFYDQPTLVLLEGHESAP